MNNCMLLNIYPYFFSFYLHRIPHANELKNLNAMKIIAQKSPLNLPLKPTEEEMCDLNNPIPKK